VDRVRILFKLAYLQERIKRILLSKDFLVGVAILGTLLAGLVIANMVAAGEWLIAATLVFAVPALIILVRFPFITLIIWLVLSPFLVQTPNAAIRAVYWLVHRMLPVVTIGIMLLSNTLHISKRQLPRFGLPEYAMLAYVVVTVASVILQNNSISATLILFYDRIFAPMCLYWLVKLSAPGENTLKWLVPIALFITITQVAIGTISWVVPSVLPSDWTKYAGQRATGSLNSVSVFTASITFSGMFLLYSGLRMKLGWKRNILILTYVATLYGVLISFSRASWLAGILVLLGIITLYPRFVMRMLLRLVPIIVVLGTTLLVSQVQQLEERFYSKDSAHTALSRLPVLVAAYRMYQAKPIFGWGYANFDRYDREFQGRFGDLANPDEKDLTSHNMFLTLLAEQGTVGFVLLLLPVFLLLFRTIQVHSNLPRSGLKGKNMTILLWLIVMTFIVLMNFAPIVVVFGLGLYWITLGLIANNLQTYSAVK